ncbi:hypothetical protein ACOMHN_066662 [Nucella lapillus]
MQNDSVSSDCIQNDIVSSDCIQSDSGSSDCVEDPARLPVDKGDNPEVKERGAATLRLLEMYVLVVVVEVRRLETGP